MITEIGPALLVNADCRPVMTAMPENHMDSIVCDPPYGLGFMGKGWDHGVPGKEFWIEALRVAKPGAYMLAFGGTRTHHRLMVAIEDAGWELRDVIMWVYGSGFPKSHNGEWGGTALKPAWEPIILARKPLIGTVAANVLEHGTGGLNIDGCRVELGATEDVGKLNSRSGGQRGFDKGGYVGGGKGKPLPPGCDLSKGRFPANLIHDGSDEVLECFPEASGQIAPSVEDGAPQGNSIYSPMNRCGPHHAVRAEQDKSAARFFYCAKASKSDREEGNKHPTVKPTALMRYLCRLVTPPDGLILDPFMGSGSTGKAALLEGFRFVGIELSAEYMAIAERRITHATIH